MCKNTAATVPAKIEAPGIAVYIDEMSPAHFRIHTNFSAALYEAPVHGAAFGYSLEK